LRGRESIRSEKRERSARVPRLLAKRPTKKKKGLPKNAGPQCLLHKEKRLSRAGTGGKKEKKKRTRELLAQSLEERFSSITGSSEGEKGRIRTKEKG